MDLFDFQKRAVSEIMDQGDQPSYLGWEMGTGKTPIAIEVMKRRKATRVLVLCPAVARLVWAKELKQWHPNIPVTQVKNINDYASMKEPGVFIVAYPMLSLTSLDWPGMIRKLTPFDMTVIDEAHYLKNPVANRTKAVLKTMRPVLGFPLPMSGSPAPNHAGELYPVLASIFPSAIRNIFGKQMNRWEFEDAFCDVVEKRFSGRSIRTIQGSKNVDKLRTRMSGFMMRKKKSEVMKELPPLTFDTYPVAVSAGDAKALAPYRDIIDPKMSDGEVLKALAPNKGEHVMRLRAALGIAKVPGAIELIDDMLEGSAANRKVVVFAHHKAVIEALMTGLGKYVPVKLDGSTSQKDRQSAIDAFLHEPAVRVFIGQLTAASTSITLVGPKFEVSDAIFVETSFNVGENVQAAARIHRIGQRDAVLARFLVAAGTLDDRIQDILARKSRDFDQLFDGVAIAEAS